MSELTDRYVGATLRSIPAHQRDDIEAELRASIGDAIEAGLAQGQDEAHVEKEVLMELGDPDRLAANYAGRPGYLIGPDHFFAYRRLLSVLLITVTPIVMAVVAIGQVIAGGGVGDVVTATLGTVLSLVVHIAFWTTLAFYFVGREAAPGTEWSLSDLPSHSSAGSIKLSDTIAAVVFLVIAIAMIFVSRELSPVTALDGRVLPIFAESMWDFWFPFLVSVLGVEIVFEIVKYRVGRWTWGLASFNLALNALVAVPLVYLIVTDRLFNPDFLAALPEALSGLEWWIAAGVVIVALIDVVQAFRKAHVAR